MLLRTVLLGSKPRKTHQLVQQHKRKVHKFPKLDYFPFDGVLPLWSKESGQFHWHDIHRNHLQKTSALSHGWNQQHYGLEELIMRHRRNSEDAVVFNYAASCYNHTFMWLSLRPGGNPISPFMKNIIENHFGSLERFQKLWLWAARAVKGCGWTWLVDNDGNLEIQNSICAGNTLGLDKVIGILCMDMWEHAYIIDYGNDIDTYVKNFFQTVDWSFVEFEFRRIPRSTKVTLHPTHKIGATPKKIKKE